MLLKNRVKGYFLSPFFMLPSFVLILGLFVPNSMINELFGIFSILFLISYLISIIVMLCYPKAQEQQKKSETRVLIQKVSDLPKVGELRRND